METNRLSKVLAAAGVASRRACEELIFEGRVKVNGQVVKVPQTQVTLGKDKILVDNKSITKTPKKHYYILNKPLGYICSNSRKTTEKIVFDLFDKDLPRLFTVGRLDKDTSGLLIVTNDGQFANKVIHPSSDIEKEYLVKVDEEIIDEHLKDLMNGCVVEGTHVKPIRVTKVRKGTLKIVIKEGKKREIRELLASCNLFVTQLTRIRIGALTLNTLPLGTYREMTENEMKQVLKNEKKKPQSQS
jgi:23S rRNA pseudouridine2605 synthase